MSSKSSKKSRTAKKAKTKKGGTKSAKSKKNGKSSSGTQISELLEMIGALQKETSSLRSQLKKQNKRITTLEADAKRAKRDIHKLQMGVGGGHTPLSPVPSLSPMKSAPVFANSDDADAEAESKTNTPPPPTSKSKAKARAKTPEPEAPPKKKRSPIKFVFDMNHQKIGAQQNGAAAVKPRQVSGTIRFGKYLNAQNEQGIARVKIVLDTYSMGSASGISLGFATKAFGDWIGSNFGQNHSCLVKGNGQFLESDEFGAVAGKEYAHKQIAKGLLTEGEGFFKEKHDVVLEMDLKASRGRVWNETLNAGGEDAAKVFEVALPEKEAVAMVVYMGPGAKKKLVVKEQSVEFVDE